MNDSQEIPENYIHNGHQVHGLHPDIEPGEKVIFNNAFYVFVGYAFNRRYNGGSRGWPTYPAYNSLLFITLKAALEGGWSGETALTVKDINIGFKISEKGSQFIRSDFPGIGYRIEEREESQRWNELCKTTFESNFQPSGKPEMATKTVVYHGYKKSDVLSFLVSHPEIGPDDLTPLFIHMEQLEIKAKGRSYTMNINKIDGLKDSVRLVLSHFTQQDTMAVLF